MVKHVNQKLVGRLMRFDRDTRRSFTLHLKTPQGRLEVDAFCPNGDGNVPASHFTEILDDLVDTRRRVEFDVSDNDDLVGIYPVKADSANVFDGAPPSRPRHRYCWSCGGRLTRRDARIGIVGAVIRTSRYGARRVAVHLVCEDDVMNEGIGVF